MKILASQRILAEELPKQGTPTHPIGQAPTEHAPEVQPMSGPLGQHTMEEEDKERPPLSYPDADPTAYAPLVDDAADGDDDGADYGFAGPSEKSQWLRAGIGPVPDATIDMMFDDVKSRPELTEDMVDSLIADISHDAYELGANNQTDDSQQLMESIMKIQASARLMSVK